MTSYLREWKRISIGIAALLAAVLPASFANAAVGDQRTTIFIGSTSYSDGTTTTLGTTFGARWALEFKKDLEWTVGGSYATTDGEFKDSSGQVTEVHARTTTVQTGLTLLFNNEPESNVVGFLGGGFSILQYDLDFDYPESEVGKTSGIGPGLFSLVGAEFRVTRNFHIIPAYQISAHSIETEDGDRFTLVSMGVVVSFRIGF